MLCIVDIIVICILDVMHWWCGGDDGDGDGICVLCLSNFLFGQTTLSPLFIIVNHVNIFLLLYLKELYIYRCLKGFIISLFIITVEQ